MISPSLSIATEGEGGREGGRREEGRKKGERGRKGGRGERNKSMP